MIISQISHFLKFINDKKVLELGVAFIISTQVNALATVFNSTIVMPVIGYLIGGHRDSLAQLKIPIGKSYILVGDFLTALVNFMMIIYIVYLVVIQVENLKLLFPPSLKVQ